jgi:hypothetical protein
MTKVLRFPRLPLDRSLSLVPVSVTDLLFGLESGCLTTLPGLRNILHESSHHRLPMDRLPENPPSPLPPPIDYSSEELAMETNS